MKKTIIKLISVLAVICIFFSGCTLVDFFSADDLLRPPKLTGENAALQAAFEASVGKDVGLFTPIAGEHRASYILFDANDDDKQEALVFYSEKSNQSVVHMHLLTESGNNWRSVADVIGSGTDVYKVDFFNIDASDNLEIAVMWTTDETKREKTLSVYQISSLEGKDDVLTSVASILVADYINLDFDNDSVDELLYMYFFVGDDVYYSGARLMDFNAEQNRFVPMSEVAFDFAILSYTGITTQRSETGYSIYLDCVLSDNNYMTELLYYDFESEALTIPDFDGKSLSSLSMRTFYSNCEDFDNDGNIDVPFKSSADSVYVFGMPAEEVVSMNFVRWCAIEDFSVIEIGNYFHNETDGYIMNVDAFYSDYYFSYDYQNRTLQVRTDSSFDENNILFSVTPDISMIDEVDENAEDDSSRREHRVIVNVSVFGEESGIELNEIKESIEIL